MSSSELCSPSSTSAHFTKSRNRSRKDSARFLLRCRVPNATTPPPPTGSAGGGGGGGSDRRGPGAADGVDASSSTKNSLMLGRGAVPRGFAPARCAARDECGDRPVDFRGRRELRVEGRAPCPDEQTATASLPATRGAREGRGGGGGAGNRALSSPGSSWAQSLAVPPFLRQPLPLDLSPERRGNSAATCVLLLSGLSAAAKALLSCSSSRGTSRATTGGAGGGAGGLIGGAAARVGVDGAVGRTAPSAIRAGAQKGRCAISFAARGASNVGAGRTTAASGVAVGETAVDAGIEPRPSVATGARAPASAAGPHPQPSSSSHAGQSRRRKWRGTGMTAVEHTYCQAHNAA
mmetsp:Transcript_13425/g.36129  ORF Transcript_13425/g.36129 Transcript_13425/m.36129 type:complete len:349 (-) Transcript_13425:22-1068(-)